MPSPIAHLAVATFGQSLLARCDGRTLSVWQRMLFYSLLALALVLPDVDFVLLLLPDNFLPGSGLQDHGTFMHSLPAIIVFATVLAVIGRWFSQLSLSYGGWWLLCASAYSVHLLMDLCTRGRGIMLLWPFSSERIASSVPLFYGAHHSQPWAWQLHLTTLGTELLFAAAIWLVARRVAHWPRLIGRKSSASSSTSMEV